MVRSQEIDHSAKSATVSQMKSNFTLQILLCLTPDQTRDGVTNWLVENVIEAVMDSDINEDINDYVRRPKVDSDLDDGVSRQRVVFY